MLRHILWSALGACAGYYVAKKHLEADFDKRLQVEVEETRKFYKNLYEEKLRRATEVAHNEGAIQAVVDITGGEEIVEEPEDTMPEEAAEALVNYQGISAASAGDNLVGNLSRTLEKKSVIVPEEELTYVKPVGPRLIEFADFNVNGGDYDQKTVVYYSDDREVIDESDEILTKELVGKHISYANLGQLSEENTTIWVRDDKHQKDFEVIWSPDSYSRDVLGNTE